MPPHAPAVFLDRDDTLIATRAVAPDGDLGDPALVRLLPGALDACRTLKGAGFRLVVVSNQGGVARGRFTTADVERVNARLNALLAGLIDAFRYCPYHPQGVVAEFAREHPWRKPAPGMILDAAKALSIDPARSWTVGNSQRDIDAGRAAGTRTILIDSEAIRGFVADSSASASSPDFIAPDLNDAARIILQESRR